MSEIQEQTNYDIRVADFGLAVFTPNDEMLNERCGTPRYMAPEVLRKLPYSYKADVFSAGSIFFNLLTRRYLFSGDTTEEIIHRNLHCQIDCVRKYITNVSP